ncbi:HWE histidine kinase domain-containing protein [Methylobacterium durans]|uniref:sensor histidine kinase n=1 Tax=Methylobacterium durans TaxID=2202825 RepID=UPI002AFE601C|nr:HWE histidine kinase domain-containing protein [Methylobacterium durans]MEA1833496.1 HWE histidine kinase domain-containing protein [Methylobacterium durans]
MALALTPALAIQGYNEYALRADRDEAVRTDALATARVVAGDLDQLSESIRQTLDIVAEAPAIRQRDPQACTEFLHRIIDKLPQIILVAVTETNGRLLCNSLGSAPGAYSVSDRDYHQRVLTTEEFAMGGFAQGVATERESVHFAQPLRDDDARVVGVLVASIDLSWLSERLRHLVPQSSTSLTVADRNGVVLVRRPDQDVWVGRPLPPERLARLARDQEAARIVTGLDGRERVVGVVHPKGVLEGLTVVIGRDRALAFADVDAATYRGIVLILLGAVLSGAGALIGGRAFIRWPMHRLLRTVAAWRAGDLRARTGIVGTSEFGQLGEAFDAMAKSVEASQDDLRAELARSRSLQDQQTTMLHELNHRVKNTLATVQALARQSRGGEEDVAQFESRLLALSKTHDLLTRDDWSGASLREVLENELGPYRSSLDQVVLEGPSVILAPRYVLAIGMMAHELTTNAAKYGALSTPAGRVCVAWSVAARGDGEKRLRLTWQESSGPHVAPPKRRGFGTRLITGAIKRELDGEIDMAFDAGGVRLTLDVPIEQAAPGIVAALSLGRAR